MQYFLDENRGITGFGYVDGPEDALGPAPLPEMAHGGHLDEYGNPRYQLTLEGDIVPTVVEPTKQQLDQKRKQAIVQNLRLIIDVDDEIALINKAIASLSSGEKTPSEYLAYRDKVELIKSSVEQVVAKE
jgi:hypothetical protein